MLKPIREPLAQVLTDFFRLCWRWSYISPPWDMPKFIQSIRTVTAPSEQLTAQFTDVHLVQANVFCLATTLHAQSPPWPGARRVQTMAKRLGPSYPPAQATSRPRHSLPDFTLAELIRREELTSLFRVHQSLTFYWFSFPPLSVSQGSFAHCYLT